MSEVSAQPQSHEPLTSHRAVSVGSDRKFGLVVGGLLAVIAVLPALRHGSPVRVWLLAIGAVLVGLGAVAPAVLAPLNRLWFRLALLLGRVTNPIVMGVLFFAVMMPIGWFLRRRGHDLLALKHDQAAPSYWIARDPAAATSLTKQF